MEFREAFAAAAGKLGQAEPPIALQPCPEGQRVDPAGPFYSCRTGAIPRDPASIRRFFLDGALALIGAPTVFYSFASDELGDSITLGATTAPIVPPKPAS